MPRRSAVDLDEDGPEPPATAASYAAASQGGLAADPTAAPTTAPAATASAFSHHPESRQHAPDSLQHAPDSLQRVSDASDSSDAPALGRGDLLGTRRARSKELLQPGGDASLVVKVLPTRLAVVRLQASMLRLSAHALMHRLLFTPSTGVRCFWSFTYTDDEISLIIDETSLHLFPPEAIVGPSTRWRPLRLCGKSFAFDETGVVSAMFAPYEEGMPLLNFSTFSTNVSLVEESDLERAIESFDLPVIEADADGDAHVALA